ncbi:hypothetical protein ER13_06425 [Brevundimonas sp. EAKA]|jgi:hypothetical protein|uniref:Uncharacterized protein n=1 Tax=Brevundimonas mediterranea TaxID=74329 RepID=A0A7Z8Y540_9CAUL|nr:MULTISPECIES: hypothetical protein [Brevundimonas]MBU4198268.1 hypothetical protein [Alphaproteobacteria bacterium]KDP95899.1 hypothetical protein ER13_06425 [Brevundimonas sp. EAKA]MBU4238290.1 hypothetical protein [Alphaproteobacteria bacterium]MCG2662856.1 hypothetical protein [Brevundimonas sp.]VDC50849.1 hypothetical protein BREV_BREV_00326 [Brevundimonas mediterranea]
MSMTYADVTTNTAAVDATGRSADEVFVPRYAQRRSRSNKSVKTWMIIAPIGALAVIGTAAALMMGGDAPAAPASSAQPLSTPAPQMQTAPTALTPVETPLAQPVPVQTTPQTTPAPVPRRAEPAVRRAAPSAPPAERPAPRVDRPVEPTGPRPYSAATAALNTAALNTAASPAASAPASVQIQPPPTVSVEPVN